MRLGARRRHQVCGALLALGVWTAAARATGPALPGPGALGPATVALYRSGALVDALAGTVGRLALGYGLAVAVAFPVGAVMGLSPSLDAFLDTYVTALFVTSVASLLPFLIIVAGTGLGFYAAVVFLFAVFHMVLVVRAGVATVDDGTRDAGRVYGATGWRAYAHVLLPAALPHVVAALRVGYNRAVKGVVVAELWVYAGVGELLHGYQRFSQTPRALVVVFHLLLVAVVGVRLLRLVERRYAGWREVSVR
jgi:ABC-type nitrate/sulfonate/bicarbonate transport system permease component